MQPGQKIKKFNTQQPTAFLSTSNEHVEFEIKIDTIYIMCTQMCLTLVTSWTVACQAICSCKRPRVANTILEEKKWED